MRSMLGNVSGGSSGIDDDGHNNADGNNDTFRAVLRDISEADFSIYIFDRWGHIIFQSDKIDETWDGTFKGLPCANGVYVWKIEYKTIESNAYLEKIGTVTLIR